MGNLPRLTEVESVFRFRILISHSAYRQPIISLTFAINKILTAFTFFGSLSSYSGL